MEEVVFYCTNCSTKLSAAPDEAGEEFECPKCGVNQVVPGDESVAEAEPQVEAEVEEPKTESRKRAADSHSSLVIRIPKKKIVLSTGTHAGEDETISVGDRYGEELSGSGLRIFAVMLASLGLVLCGFSLYWAVAIMNSVEVDWWFKMLIFMSTFMMGVMGLVMAGFIFLLVRMASRLDMITGE